MSNPSTWQLISNVAVFFGVVLAGLGGWGNYYFGKRADEIATERAQNNQVRFEDQINALARSNEELKESLDPFKDLALSRFPNDDIDAALRKLSEDFDRLEKETKKTTFMVLNERSKTNDDGTYEQHIELQPIGINVVPLLTVQASTAGNVELLDVEVDGPTIPRMSTTSKNDDDTVIRREFTAVRPGPVTIVIRAVSKPQRLNVIVDPLQKEST